MPRPAKPKPKRSRRPKGWKITGKGRELPDGALDVLAAICIEAGDKALTAKRRKGKAS